ncbi:hypothetical protein D3C84_1031660 [compost metagenome]
MLPGVFSNGFRAKGPIQVDMFPCKFPDVVMQKTLRLADKYQIVTAVTVDFHRAQAIVFNLAPVRR